MIKQKNVAKQFLLNPADLEPERNDEGLHYLHKKVTFHKQQEWISFGKLVNYQMSKVHFFRTTSFKDFKYLTLQYSSTAS